MFFSLRNYLSNGVLKEIGPQNGGKFWTDEKKQTIMHCVFSAAEKGHFWLVWKTKKYKKFLNYWTDISANYMECYHIGRHS